MHPRENSVYPRGGCHANNPPHIIAGVLCANCGGGGHTFRVCDLPITSFGVVCFRVTQIGDTQFLLVQRKDSLCYVEFIRGKYNLQNRCYITRLLSNMTHVERGRLMTASFDELWNNFWQDERCKSFAHEYNQSKSRFNALRAGFGLRTASTGDIVDIDLSTLLDASGPGFSETEWGFPKGRRNIDESDNNCAVREFKEETGLLSNDIHRMRPFRSFEETFTGSNKVRYRHVYYTYRTFTQDLLLGEEGSSPPRPVSIHQSKEISRVAWFGKEEVLSRIRSTNNERREMFKRVCNYVGTLAVQRQPRTNDT